MKVFFNHLSKCGGSTINEIALKEYKDDFHLLKQSTTSKELSRWLSRENSFISSEINPLKCENVYAILKRKDFLKIIISRDPVERFISFCGHSTRDQIERKQGISLWGHEYNIRQEFSANGWMRCCLARMNLVLQDEQDRQKLIDLDVGWTFPIFSQWMLASFMSHFDCDSNMFSWYGSGQQRRHIEHWRSMPDLAAQMKLFLCSFYSALGTTEDIYLFVEMLCDLGVFSDKAASTRCEIYNSSKKIQSKSPELFAIKEELIAEYYSLVPEDFYFHSICRQYVRSYFKKRKGLDVGKISLQK